jgi:hypothetical protein
MAARSRKRTQRVKLINTSGVSQNDALGPSCDLPDSLLKPIQSLRRNDALHLRTSRKAKSEKLPLLRSRATALFASFTLRLSCVVMNRATLSITR